MIFIFTTVGDKEVTLKVGQGLLKRRLIACYNLFPIESGFWWQGKVTQESEFLMILKTEEANFDKISKFLHENSGYDTPEVVMVKTDRVSDKYLTWLNSELKSPRRSNDP